MIRFIQKYQWYFYVIITTVIVISFSFFGTYGTMQNSNIHEQVAFTTTTGEKVTRGELESMSMFLSSDIFDKQYYGSVWGPNFLNDGVIRKDFLETGLGVELISAFSPELKKDLESKLIRERSFKPYRNSQAPFLSAETAWTYFAPSINKNLSFLQSSVDPMSKSALQARVDLYLAEKQFPAGMLAQVIRYQERQYGWLQPDPLLTQTDLSLFGYHSFDDWFGTKFTRLVSQFIFNAADIAESRGYKVSKEEAYADLVKTADQSFQDLKANSDMPFTNRADYMNEQLRRMGFDTAKAVKIWQKVLLFRRLFNDIGNAQIVDPKTFSSFHEYAQATIKGELYRLPEPLRLNDMKSLAEFETYLALTSNHKAGELDLPKTAKSIDEVKKETPELVQKRYLIEVKQVTEKGLEGRISLKDTLTWETTATNFQKLQKEFPDLGIKKGETLDQRVEALESLDDKMRARVDLFARASIIASHPEWIKETMASADPVTRQITVTLKGGPDPLPGLKNRQELMDKLDKQDIVELYSQDGKTTYSFKVLDRSTGYELLTFSEAKTILPELVKAKLEPYYNQVKGDKPEFKTEKGVKPFDEVQSDIAALYFEPIVNSIKTSVKGSLKDKAPANMIPDIAASYRFFNGAEAVIKDPSQVKASNLVEESGKLSPRGKYEDQFGWIKEDKKITRSSKVENGFKEPLFKLKPNQWSEIMTPPNGDLTVFRLLAIEKEALTQAQFDETFELVSVLGNEAKQLEFNNLVPLLKEKRAISFDYLNQVDESMEPEIAIPVPQDV